VDERQTLRDRLGRVGVWTFAFDSESADDVRRNAAEIESLGFPALWVPESMTSRDVFAHLSLLLGATERIAICSGIANVTARDPWVMSSGARTLADAWGDRVVVGLGIGHPYTTESRGLTWAKPLERMAAYLDAMDRAPWSAPTPKRPVRRILAALGPKMLTLAAERALGAHTYFVPIEHTAAARATLGPEPVLAVEQTVVLSDDPARAREVARAWARHYLALANYANNLRRMGFSDDDVSGEGSDRLIDATIAWGDVEAVRRRVAEHLEAGADHVCVQVISGDDADACVPQLKELAPGLLGRR
jgi:probable F420-dependent oxidoreductase